MTPNQQIWVQARDRLVAAVTSLGYSAELAELMARELGSPKAIDRMTSYIRQARPTSEEMLVLTEKLATMHADLYRYTRTLDEQHLADFIKIEYGRIGADTHITPREVIRDFIELLDILYQHPGTDLRNLLQADSFNFAKPAEEEGKDIDSRFAEFTI